MARWILNEAHTAAEFCVRHMMITYVRGHFKNIGGTLDFDQSRPEEAWVDVSIAAATLWSGEPARRRAAWAIRRSVPSDDDNPDGRKRGRGFGL